MSMSFYTKNITIIINLKYLTVGRSTMIVFYINISDTDKNTLNTSLDIFKKVY